MDNVLTNNKPNAILIITQSYNPSGASSGTYNPSPVGVYYSSASAPAFPNKWCVFNQGASSSTAPAMPANASFNILVLNQ